MKFEMKEQEKYVLLGVIVCTLVIFIGYSFAYYTSSFRLGDNTGSSVSVPTADLIDVVYNAGDEIAPEILYPGMSVTKEFDVTVTPTKDDKDAIYDIILNITENEFVACSSEDCVPDFKELVYSLSYTIDDDDTVHELVTSKDLTGVTDAQTTKVTHTALNGETTYHYKLTVSFQESGKDQNYNEKNNFKGNIDVQLANK